VWSIISGRKWRTATVELVLPRTKSLPPGMSEDLASGLSAVGSADLQPGSAPWQALVLDRFGAVAKRSAPDAPVFLQAVADPGDEAGGALLTGIGVALADGLEWLVAADAHPEKADAYRAAALERFGTVRADMEAIAALPE
jgi:hypothetical protein